LPIFLFHHWLWTEANLLFQTCLYQ